SLPRCLGAGAAFGLSLPYLLELPLRRFVALPLPFTHARGNAADLGSDPDSAKRLHEAGRGRSAGCRSSPAPAHRRLSRCRLRLQASPDRGDAGPGRRQSHASGESAGTSANVLVAAHARVSDPYSGLVDAATSARADPSGSSAPGCPRLTAREA